MDENKKPQLDPTKLTSEQRDKLEAWQNSRDQLKAMEDVADLLTGFLQVFGEQKDDEERSVSQIGALIVDTRESIERLSKTLSADPKPTDYSPVTEQLKKLELSLSKSLSKLELSPTISVDAPNVTVESSKVDLSGIESAMKKIPAEFKKAIESIPKVEIPEAPDRWDEVLKKLSSIDTATRIKPQAPTTVKVTNVDGSPVGGGSVPTGTGLPEQGDTFVPVRNLPSVSYRAGFDKVVASNGVDTADMTIVGAVGTGHAVSQTAGSLVITSGTTAASEVTIRSNSGFNGNLNLRYSATLSQRIANNNFFIELVDVIGDGLAYSITSATTIVVTIPSSTVTSQNIGQSMYIGCLNGTGTKVSGRYPIAAVSGNDVTFTVSGFTVGTGTCSLFGWNYNHVLYNGVTPTSAAYDTQRNGWASGDTTATINTTTSGHIGTLGVANATAVFMDSLSASATTVELTQRASRQRNIPDRDTTLYVQVRSANGTTSPASGTTFTVGFIEVNNFVTQPVSIVNVLPQSRNVPLSTVIEGTVPVSGTITATVANATTAASATVTGQSTIRIPSLVATAQTVKASSGRLYSYFLQNPDVGAVWVHFYNALIAGVTVGTTLPLWSVYLPIGGAADISFEVPISFSTAISIAATTTLTGAVAPATGSVAFVGYA